MAGPPTGSIYHLSSLRYAKASTSYSIHVSSPREEGGECWGGDAGFERAEDSYRPGQSSSSSLLIRSNARPLTGKDTQSAAAGTRGQEEDSGGREADGEIEAWQGFQRTKARAVMAQSVAYRQAGLHDDQMAELTRLGDQGQTSIYLHNRRAKHPLSRVSYEQTRAKKRKYRGEAKKAEPDGDDDAGMAERMVGEGEREEQEEENWTEEVKRRIQSDVESLEALMPDGSLLEVVHYLAAHYYDARGMLRPQQTASSLQPFSRKTSLSDQEESPEREESSERSEKEEEGDKTNVGQGANMLQVCEGNALVALAVYLEESIRYELANEPSKEMQERAESGHREAEQTLAKREEARKRTLGKRTSVPSTKNGWARTGKEGGRTKVAAKATRNDDGHGS